MAPLPYLQVLRGPLELLRLLLVQPVLKEASVVVHGLLVELGQHAGAPLLRTTSVVHLLLGSYVVLPDLPFLGRRGGEEWRRDVDGEGKSTGRYKGVEGEG